MPTYRLLLLSLFKHLKQHFWIRTHLSQTLNLASISYSPWKRSFLSGRLKRMRHALKPCIKAELLQTGSLLSLLTSQFIHPPAWEHFTGVKLYRASSASMSVNTIPSISEGLYPSAPASKFTHHTSAHWAACWHVPTSPSTIKKIQKKLHHTVKTVMWPCCCEWI